MVLYYRGNTRRVIAGPGTGAQYDCAPRSFIEVDSADVPGLLRMVKARCGCGHLFIRRRPR